VGGYAREKGVERLFATGPLSTLAVEAFGVGASWHADTDSLSRVVAEALSADVTLLV
jgi:UDP-N-acetylmuramoyl-tripeptide--D-alanyl-D-alanine ligase